MWYIGATIRLIMQAAAYKANEYGRSGQKSLTGYQVCSYVKNYTAFKRSFAHVVFLRFGCS